MAELLLRFKTRLVRRIPLDKPMIRVGRDATADIAIDNPSVSRSHCFLSWADGVWRVTDTGSENGTYVNGARVTDQPLKLGDRIELGLFNLTLSESSEGTEAAPLAASGPAPVIGAIGSTVALTGDDIQAMLRSYQQDAAEAAAANPVQGHGVPAPELGPASRTRSAPVQAAPATPGNQLVQRALLGAGVVLIAVGVLLWALDLI
jgi:pSer/pThr/pTyr-binding forkhead associated (FHA) protein